MYKNSKFFLLHSLSNQCIFLHLRSEKKYDVKKNFSNLIFVLVILIYTHLNLFLSSNKNATNEIQKNPNIQIDTIITTKGMHKIYFFFLIFIKRSTKS